VQWVGAAALTVASVGAVAVTLSAARESATHPPPPRTDAAALHWRSVTLERQPVESLPLPAAVLYVLPSCSHCAPAVKRFAAEARGRRLTRLVIAGSDAGDVHEYQQRLGLSESIAIDSGRAFARSAKLEWVPSLILISADSIARVAPIPAPALIARYLKQLR
jgi:hypothetical protein